MYVFPTPQSSNEVTLDPTLAMRMRANTVSGGGPHYLNSSAAPQRTAPPPPSVAHITVNKRTFAQLHSEYGVPILRDKEANRAKKGKQDTRSSTSHQTNSNAEGVVVMNLVDV